MAERVGLSAVVPIGSAQRRDERRHRFGFGNFDLRTSNSEPSATTNHTNDTNEDSSEVLGTTNHAEDTESCEECRRRKGQHLAAIMMAPKNATASRPVPRGSGTAGTVRILKLSIVMLP